MSVRELTMTFAVNGELLGDRVQRMLDCDIDVVRYVEKHRSHACGRICGIRCAYAYSTHASVGGATLGHAVVYRACRPTTWLAITQGRMKDTLRHLGHGIVNFGYVDSSDLLWRVIAAPAVEPLVVIREVLLLSAIDVALERRPRQAVPTFPGDAHPPLTVETAAQEAS